VDLVFLSAIVMSSIVTGSLISDLLSAFGSAVRFFIVEAVLLTVSSSALVSSFTIGGFGG